jgi:hypothetical protein
MPDTDAQKTLARRELVELAPTSNALYSTVESIDVNDDDSCATMADLRQQLTNAKRKIEARRKAIRDPLNKALKEINELFAVPIKQLDDALELSKVKLDDYAKMLVEIERAEFAAAREAAEKEFEETKQTAETLRASGADEAAAALEESAAKSIDDTKAAVKTVPVRGKRASMSVAKTWRARVYNIKELCKAVGDGLMPTSVIDTRDANLHALAREAGKAQQKYGVEFYEQISSVTK